MFVFCYTEGVKLGGTIIALNSNSDFIQELLDGSHIDRSTNNKQEKTNTSIKVLQFM